MRNELNVKTLAFQPRVFATIDDIGNPTVMARPAKKVTITMGPFAFLPYFLVSNAKHGS